MIQDAEMINTPVQTRYLNDISRQKNQGLDWQYSAISLDTRVELMALKKAEHGQYSVIRIVNNRDNDVENVRFHVPLTKKCYLSDVQEKKKTELENKNGEIIIKNIMSNTFVTVIIE